MLLFHAVLRNLTIHVVIAACQTFFHFRFLQQPSSSWLGVAYSNQVRAASKISAGGVGSPYNQLYTVSYPSSSTNYRSKDI